jgi:hypothetical protein
MPTNRWFVYPNVTVYAPMFNLNIRWDEEPMMVDSEILGGNYGTLQVTYILTEYPVKVTYNKTLIYAWYQGPNAYNYTVTQYLFPAVLITPSIYALVNATTQPINTFYALGYLSPGYIRPYVPAIIPGSIIPINLGLSMLVAQDSISSDTMALAWDWGRLITLPYYADYLPVDYLNGFAVPLIGLYIPPYGYPLMPVWPTYLGYHGLFWTVAISLYPYQWFIDYTVPNTPVLPLFNITDFIVNMETYKFSDMYYGLQPGKSWLNNSLYALPLPDIYDDGVYMIGATAYMLGENDITYVNQPIFANITITQLNGTDLICMRSNPLRQLKPASWYPMNISEVVPSLDVGVYYMLGNPVNKSYAPIIYIPETHTSLPCSVFGPCPGTYVPILKPSGFFIPLLQVENVTSLCFIPTLNGTYFIVVYIPPQSLLKSVYVKTSAINLSLIDNWPEWPTWKFVLSQISNASGTAYMPVLIVLTNRSFAMDYNDVVNPMSPDVLWLNIVQPQYVTVTTNLTALKLLFPNATITPFSVNITSNGTLTSSGTGVVIVNASSTTPTPITYSGGASTTIMQVQYMATYFAGVTAKVVLNTVGTDLTPLVARFGLPLFSVNGTASTTPIAVLALPKVNNTVMICIPPVIGPIVVVNSGCFNATITANETLPLVIYVRLPVNLNITAINNNGKLVVKVSGTDFFGNAVVYYPINVTVYLSNGTAAYTAVIRNGIAEVSTGLPYQGNTLVTAQGNGTGAYLPASASTYVPVTSVSTLPPWLAYIGSIWWLLLLVILLVVLIVIMIILERKRAKKRRVRAYTPYWV